MGDGDVRLGDVFGDGVCTEVPLAGRVDGVDGRRKRSVGGVEVETCGCGVMLVAVDTSTGQILFLIVAGGVVERGLFEKLWGNVWGARPNF